MTKFIRTKRHSFLLSFVLLYGTIIRLFRLGYQNQWNDEALSVSVASGTVQQILTNQFFSSHPPGYYLLLHYWLNWFGRSDAALRLFSALAGIASLFVMYALGKTLFNRTAGLWATAITAVMPFHLYYSQEIRSYSWLFLLSSLLLLSQMKVLRGSKWYWWGVYGVTAVTGLYMHYLFPLIIGTAALYFIIYNWSTKKESANWRTFFITHLVIGLSYLPMIFWAFSEADRGIYFAKDINLASYISLLLNYTVGQFLPAPIIMAGFGLILTIVIITLLQAGRAAKQRTATVPSLIFTLMAYWLPVTLTYLVSIFWIPLTTPRLMIVAVPGLYLMLAWGTTFPKEKSVNAVLVAGLLVMGLMANYNWLFNPAYQRPSVKNAVDFLSEQITPDERVVYANDSGFRLFHLYAPDLDHYLYYDEANEFVNRWVEPAAIELTGGGILTPEDSLTGTFWLILYQDFDVDLQEDIFQQFESRYRQLDSFTVEGVRLYHYQAMEHED